MSVSLPSAPDSMRIAVIYRPPALSCAKFIEDFTSFLEDNALGGDSLLIIGDFNVHMDTPNHTYPKKLLELCSAFDLAQHVSFPTHIKGHIVDLIFSRLSDTVKPAQARKGELRSDHYMLCCNLTISRPLSIKREIAYRNLKSIDIEQFRDDIRKLSIYKHVNELDLEELVEAYDTQLARLLDAHAPIINRKTSALKRDPWIDQDILDSNRNKRKAERKFRKNQNEENYRIFSEKRNNFRSLLAQTKTKYLECELSKCENDSKLLYRKLNKIMHREKENPLPDHQSEKELANQFSQYFKGKIDKIRETFSDSNERAFCYDTGFDGLPLVNLTPISEEKMIQIIKSSKPKSCALDPIPTELIKACGNGTNHLSYSECIPRNSEVPSGIQICNSQATHQKADIGEEV